MPSADGVISVFLISVQILTRGGAVVGLGKDNNNNIAKSASAEDVDTLLILENDSPTILDASATFHARLILPDEVADGEEYRYVWKQTTPGKQKQTQFASDETNLTEKYEEGEFNIVGTHSMTVDVFQAWRPFRKIAHNVTLFEITEYITGLLDIKQKNVTSSSQGTFATNQEIDFLAEIQDPSRYFREANMSFTWNFGRGFSKNTSQAHTVHSFGKAAVYNINVNITALVPHQEHGVYAVKTGRLDQKIKLMDSVTDLRILGSSEVTVGDRLNYTMSCNGSLPVTLCWYLLSESGCEASQNDSMSDLCEEIVLHERCRHDIELDFNSTGQHCFGVWAENDVSVDLAEFDISVIPPPWPPFVTASVTSLALLTTVGSIFVAVFAILQVLRARRAQFVEVADFDFRRSRSYRDGLYSIALMVPSPSGVKRDRQSPEKTPLLDKPGMRPSASFTI